MTKTIKYYTILLGLPLKVAKFKTMKKTILKINNLAKELNISIQTIKNYETWGILPKARRDEKKWRYYTNEDILKIKALFADEIKQDLNKHKKKESFNDYCSD